MNEIQKKLIKSYVDRLDVYLSKVTYNAENMQGFYILVNPDTQKVVGIISIVGGLVETAGFDGNYFNFRYIGFHTHDKHNKSVISDYILDLLYDKGILQYRAIDYNYISFNIIASEYIGDVTNLIYSGQFIKL
jgi:hypothetical protein